LVANLTDNFNVQHKAGPYAAYMVTSGKTSNDSTLGSSESELNTDDFPTNLTLVSLVV
jgi:hypothetical protein